MMGRVMKSEKNLVDGVVVERRRNELSYSNCSDLVCDSSRDVCISRVNCNQVLYLGCLLFCSQVIASVN